MTATALLRQWTSPRLIGEAVIVPHEVRYGAGKVKDSVPVLDPILLNFFQLQLKLQVY